MDTQFDDLVTKGPRTEPGPLTKKTRDKKAGLRRLDEAVWQKMQDEWHHGKPKGHTTFVEHLDPHFTWKKEDLIIMTGWPNEGKTEILFQLMIVMAMRAGWRWALFSPENMPETEIYDTLIHAFTGQPTDRTKAGHISLERYEAAKDIIAEHFVVVDVPHDSDEVPTLECILDYFEAAKEEMDVDGVLIDPWNQLAHDEGGQRTDQYLSNQLSVCKRFARKHEVVFVITAHPNKPNGYKSGDQLPVPDAFLLNGGSMWNNKADVVMATYRPNKHSSIADPSVAFYVHKVKKQKLVGIPGSIGEGSANPMVRIEFNRQTNRHYFNGVSPLDHQDVQRRFAAHLVDPPPAFRSSPSQFGGGPNNEDYHGRYPNP
jgi:twinkle protein